jgi:hypothetical protein
MRLTSKEPHGAPRCASILVCVHGDILTSLRCQMHAFLAVYVYSTLLTPEHTVGYLPLAVKTGGLGAGVEPTATFQHVVSGRSAVTNLSSCVRCDQRWMAHEG